MAATPATFHDLYNDHSRCPWNGEFQLPFHLFDTEGATITQPVRIRQAISNSALQGQPVGIVLLVQTAGTVMVQLFHHVFRHDAGIVPQPFDDQTLAFMGDVYGNQDPHCVVLDDEMFNRTNNIRLPTAAQIDTEFAADPNAEMVGPYADGDAGTELKRTRQASFLPNRYAALLLNGGLTPKEAWIQIRGAIVADGKEDECANFITWLRAALTSHTAAGDPSAIIVGPPAPPQLPTPQAVIAYRRFVHGVVTRALPAFGNTPSNALADTFQAINTMGRFLLEAAKAGQIEKIQGMLDKGLFCAGEFGNTEMVELMLDWGANVNARDDNGDTLLVKAIGNHETNLVKILLDHGADTSLEVGGLQQTPLHWAVSEAMDDGISLDIVRLLLQSGADVHALDDQARTPIYRPAAQGNTEIVELLLNHGANANGCEDSDRTPLHSAAQNGQMGIIQCLLDRGADINRITNNGETPLHLAAEYAHTETAELLLRRGANIDATDARGRTPLFSVLWNGHVETVRCLLDGGADIHIVDEDGVTALHDAARFGATGTVQCLLDQGANINAFDANGKTPFHSAAYGGHTKIARLLLDRGADINAVDNSGWTPLHSAAAGASPKSAEFLLEQGGINTVNVADQQGNTPLLVVGPDLYNKRFEIVRLLLDRGAEVNTQNNEGKTFLHKFASGPDEPELLALLIDRGVDPNLIDSDGKTPIHIAAGEGKLDFVCSLLYGGVDMNFEVLDVQNLSPLFYASTSGNNDLVRFLLQEGLHAMFHVT